MSVYGVPGAAHFGVFTPRAKIRERSVTLPGADVEAGPVFVTPSNQKFRFIVEDDTTGFRWSMVITGGTTNDPRDTNRFYVGRTDSLENCTIVQANESPLITVTTPAGDSGGRQYAVTYYPGTSAPPTIQKTVANPLATTITVTVVDLALYI